MNQNIITIPFRKVLLAGQKTFSINIPTTVAEERDFTFGHVRISPGIFSDLSVQLKLDSEAELNEIASSQMFFTCNLSDNCYGETFAPGNYYTNQYDLAKAVGYWTEVQKQPGFSILPMFMQWDDNRYDWTNPTETWDEWMERNAQDYYGTPLNPSIHKGFLPESARITVFANDYAFPVAASDNTKEYLRYSIHVGPNVTAVLSTDKQFLQMGFSANQLKRGRNRQIRFKNAHSTNWNIIFARSKPSYTNVDYSTEFKITPIPTSTFFKSPSGYFRIRRRDAYKNINYRVPMLELFHKFKLACSFDLKFNYNTANKTFSFYLPPRGGVINTFILYLEPDLCLRLGFGLEQYVAATTPNGVRTGEFVDDNINYADADIQAKAITNDTAMIIITDDNSSSYSTVGSTQKMMATLYPDSLGSMILPPDFYTLPKISTRVPSYLLGSAPSTKLTFRFQRIDDDDVWEDFTWVMKGTISGQINAIKRK